jgi:signal transduction histidine kinase
VLAARGAPLRLERLSAVWARFRPPVERRDFWIVQALVAGVAALHTWVEYQHLLDEHSPVYLFPTTLYLIPVIYASLTFGLTGAIATAVWSAILVLPNLLIWHDGMEALGELVQVAWIALVAIFVGLRVDGERTARAQAEGNRDRLRLSEERYRGIIDTIAEPIVLLDADHRVLAANGAAVILFETPGSDLLGGPLPGSAGAAVMEALAFVDATDRQTIVRRLGPHGRWYELNAMPTRDPGGGHGLQFLLVDVTASHERVMGLEGLTRQTIVAREKERLRISREIHDGPLQSLVALLRGLDAVVEEAPPEAGPGLRQVRQVAEDVAGELRRVSRDLRPSILDDLGVLVAIRAEARDFEQRTGIRTKVEENGAIGRLRPDAEIAMLRICQEALRNVDRHAQAGRVTILLETTERPGVRMRVVDDGVGLPLPLDRSALVAHGHLGLIGMDERARIAGGELALMPATGGGLCLQLDLPHLSPEPEGVERVARNEDSSESDPGV